MHRAATTWPPLMPMLLLCHSLEVTWKLQREKYFGSCGCNLPRVGLEESLSDSHMLCSHSCLPSNPDHWHSPEDEFFPREDIGHY